MSRYTKSVIIADKNHLISYGFDRMLQPQGYFIQIYSLEEDGEEVYLVNVGFVLGVGKTKIIEVLEAYNITLPEEHMMKLSLDLPF